MMNLPPNVVRSKEFLDAGKRRLAGDAVREATSSDVTDLRKENDQLKAELAETILHERVLPPLNELERAIGQWVEHYNNKRYHVSSIYNIARDEIGCRQIE